MNLVKILCFATLIYLPLISHSQSDFLSGYVIIQGSDTTFGLIRHKDSKVNSIDFKINENQPFISYNAGDIIGYGFKNDQYFQSRNIDTGTGSLQFVFLEVLISGKVSLYRLEKDFYIEKHGQGLLKMSSKTIETVVDGKVMHSHSKSYLGILNLLLGDSPELTQEKIFNTSFGEKPISEIVKQYNRSVKSSMTIYNFGKPWVHTRFGVSGGIISSRLVIETDNPFYHLGPFVRSTSPIVGVNFEILSPRINENFSFIVDMLLSESNFDSHNSNEFAGKITNNTVSLTMNHLTIPFGFRYIFKGKNHSAFVNTGLSETVTLKSNTSWIEKVDYLIFHDTYQKEALELVKGQIGIWGGAGVSIGIGKKINTNLELRYEVCEGINAVMYSYYNKSKLTDFQILLSLSSR